jgi:hypothetical protein
LQFRATVDPFTEIEECDDTNNESVDSVECSGVN